MPFALREELATKRSGKDVWYRGWTKIGPCCTSKPEERALMKEGDDWMQSQALQHSLCFFEIVELPEGCEGDFDWNKI